MIVVDTQAVVWLTQDTSLLSKPAREALVFGRRDGALAIADITLNEIAMLITRGRLRVSTPLNTYLGFIESQYHILPITASIAERAMQFGRGYPTDPADRLIGATAVVMNARLVTKDARIRASGEVECVW